MSSGYGCWVIRTRTSVLRRLGAGSGWFCTAPAQPWGTSGRDFGARYRSALPGGVPAEAYDGHDSSRALEIARDVRDFVGARLAERAADWAT